MTMRQSALAITALGLALMAWEGLAQPAATPAPAGAAAPVASPATPESADGKGSRRFQRLDANHDGRLSREEAARSPNLAKHFDEIDTNHDGFISPQEKRTAWQVRAAARKSAAPAPAAGTAGAVPPAQVAPAAHATEK